MIGSRHAGSGRRGRCAAAAVVAGMLLWAGPATERASAQAPAPRGGQIRLPPVPDGRTGQGYVDFSFDQVDIANFVKLVGDRTGLKFVLSEGVNGKITVVSPRIPRDQIYPFFVKIIESVGCSVIQDGDVHRVVLLAPRLAPLAPVVGPDEDVPESGVVTKILRLEHIMASDLKRVLDDKVIGGKAGGIGAIDETNHLIVTDTVETILRIERIIAEVDRPGLARVTEVVPLQYASAEAMAQQLNLAIAEAESRGERLVRRLPQAPGSQGSTRTVAGVVASPHANSLILVGTTSQIGSLKTLIEQIDVDTPVGRGRLNAIFLRYLDAEEAAKNINGLLEKSGGKEEGTAQKRIIAIEADVSNNALLISASPSDFDAVKKLVDQLDLVPQQVHITVIIAQVTVTDELNLGVQMAALDMPSGVGDTVVQAASTLQNGTENLMNTIQKGIIPGGLTVGVAYGSRVDADGRVVTSFPGLFNIDAVKQDARFEILSETSLEAQNNREASVKSVNEIPILKSTIEGGSGTARDVIQNIERVDVGVKLRLTPHIIPGGEVQMELNPSIEAVIGYGSGDNQLTPTIARREVSTTVTVPDGEMIVIAGLTRKDETEIERRVPILGYIPLIGRLFRHTSTSSEKTDLLIFVTPRIVNDIVVAREVMEEWRHRTGLDPDEQE